MADGIAEIRDRAATIIESATPDVRPGIPYVEAPQRNPILSQPATQSLLSTSRVFEIIPGRPVREGEFDGVTVDQLQVLTFTIRYLLQKTATGWVDLCKMAYSDQARVHERLLRPAIGTHWNTTPLLQIYLDASTELLEAPDLDGVWYTQQQYIVLYRLESS